MFIEIKILDDRAAVPLAGTDWSAGVDLPAILETTLTIPPGAPAVLIGTGLSISLGNGYAALLLPRSGLGHKKGLVLGNLVGLIDGDYQGELFISAWNRSDTAIDIQPGERIAQMVIVPVVQPLFVLVKEFSERTLRGDGGFGHTGSL